MLDTLCSWYDASFSVFFFVINFTLVLTIGCRIMETLLSRESSGHNKHALITGCDTGFGYSTTYELNARGVHVFAACLTADAVQKFNDDDNFKGTAFVMNITNQQDIDQAREMIAEVVGDKGLDILFNNAGVFSPGPIEWQTEDDFKMPMEVNVWGHVKVIKAMLPLVKKCRGRIINTCSIAGRISLGGISSYSMSKYAFEAFSDALRLEMKPWGVSVHIIEPGVMATSLYDQMKRRMLRLWEALPSETKEQFGKAFLDAGLAESETTVSKLAGNPKQVVTSYVHAALSTRPKLRYLIGLDAKFMAFMTMLPTPMGDALQKLIVKPIQPAKAVF